MVKKIKVKSGDWIIIIGDYKTGKIVDVGKDLNEIEKLIKEKYSKQKVIVTRYVTFPKHGTDLTMFYHLDNGECIKGMAFNTVSLCDDDIYLLEGEIYG